MYINKVQHTGYILKMNTKKSLYKKIFLQTHCLLINFKEFVTPLVTMFNTLFILWKWIQKNICESYKNTAPLKNKSSLQIFCLFCMMGLKYFQWSLRWSKTFKGSVGHLFSHNVQHPDNRKIITKKILHM